MAQDQIVSNYQEIARSFLDEFPIGTQLLSSAMLRWVEKHPNGAAIKPDLLIGDAAKKISSVRRHLNDGGRSNALPEKERFQIEVDDPKAGRFVVRSFADINKAKARGAIPKSISGALAPLNSGRKAIAAVKLDELPELEQKVFEIAKANIEALEKVVKPTMAQEVDRIWNARLAQDGFTPEQARKIREMLPEVTRLQKLLKVTS